MHKSKNSTNPSVWNRIRRSNIFKLLVCLLGAGMVLLIMMLLLDDPKSTPNSSNQSAIWKEKLKMNASSSNMAAYQEESVKTARLPEKFATATFALG